MKKLNKNDILNLHTEFILGNKGMKMVNNRRKVFL